MSKSFKISLFNIDFNILDILVDLLTLKTFLDNATLKIKTSMSNDNMPDDELAICPQCDSQVPLALKDCQDCHTFVGFPNVRHALLKEEADALETRYLAESETAEKAGQAALLSQLEEDAKQTRISLAMPLSLLHQLLNDDKSLYSNY